MKDLILSPKIPTNRDPVGSVEAIPDVHNEVQTLHDTLGSTL